MLSDSGPFAFPRARIHGNGCYRLRNGADGEADTQAAPDVPPWAITRRKWLMRRIRYPMVANFLRIGRILRVNPPAGRLAVLAVLA